MKQFLMLSLFFLTSNILGNCQTRRHFVFNIHGVAGHKGNFGYLGDVIKKHLGHCFESHSFEYDTDNDFLSTNEFAFLFDNYLKKFFKEKGLRSKDRISIISHSQGGIIGFIWLKDALRQNKQSISYKLSQKMSSFITIGTPYWGAWLAGMGKSILYPNLPFLKYKNPASPFGRLQLNEMTFGSDTILDTAKNYNKVLSLVPQMRTLAIGGRSFKFSTFLGEDDNVVPAYSSNPDHFYYLEETKSSDSKSIVAATEFSLSKRTPYKLIKGSHFRSIYPGISLIPKECLDDLNCGHPAVAPILNHLQGNDIDIFANDVDRHIYRVTNYIKTPDHLDLADDDIEIVFLNNFRPHSLRKNKKLRANKKLITNDKFLKRVSFTGKTDSQHPINIKYLIKAKGLETRSLEVPVEGGRSTILEIVMTEAID